MESRVYILSIGVGVCTFFLVSSLRNRAEQYMPLFFFILTFDD